MVIDAQIKKIHLGIIGYGFMGHWHYNHAGNMDEVKIEAVCDIDSFKLKDVSHNIRVYTDYRELLKDTAVEWVVIAVPNHLHHDICIAAANAGKNIIVEKPCALDVKDFDEMYESAEKNSVLFTVDQNRRWDRDFSMVKKALDQNLIGQIYMIRSSMYGVFGRVHDWHQYPVYGGGMLYDWGVHLIDQMLNLVPGKIRQISADIKSVINAEVDDYFKIWLYFDSGLVGEIELGTFLLKTMPRWYIAGDCGTMVIDNIKADSGAIFRSKEFREKLPEHITDIDAGPTRTFSVKADDAVYTEPLPKIHRKANDWNDFFRNIFEVVNGKGQLEVKPEQVHRVLRVMDTVRVSAAMGKSVEFVE